MPDVSGRRSTRLTVGEQIVIRLIGLFLFLAPKRGMEFILDCVPKVARRVEAIRRAEKETSHAA